MSQAGTRDHDWGILTAILAAIWVSIMVMVLRGHVHDLGTAGSLFSILGLHVGVIVYVAARYLSRKFRSARLLALRREDRRNKDHLGALINLCRSLVLGARASGLDSVVTMSAMRHAAYHMATARAMYGYLFTDAGVRIAEDVRDLALSSISRQSCALADFPLMLLNLARLHGEIRDIDGDFLAGRRRREAGAADPGTE